MDHLYIFINCLYEASGSVAFDDDMTAADEAMEISLRRDLEQQITNAIDSRFLLQLVSGIECSILLFKLHLL